MCISVIPRVTQQRGLTLAKRKINRSYERSGRRDATRRVYCKNLIPMTCAFQRRCSLGNKNSNNIAGMKNKKKSRQSNFAVSRLNFLNIVTSTFFSWRASHFEKRNKGRGLGEEYVMSKKKRKREGNEIYVTYLL